ncbi:male-specific lethal 2-like protein [Plakobranchus ocellatus]|uniref:Male-specific lethal 2-like protein n=1 Tax=Plakobranchus ocellatus TaxID=259542 RepID=A0AAV4E0Y2_9GAST|nr:male-specific lethal 2-like protein [Plakobranchus ocellatus]
MSADPDDKSSWSEIFKYLPSLRQMLSCCVCGNVAFRPHGPDHNVCLHFVCEGCKGGKMRLKPSCSWCKDQDSFVENKRIRVLINCFKRLCLYISSSHLGQEIEKASVNGHGSEADRVLKIIEEVGNFEDEISLTPAPSKVPKVPKLVSQPLKYTPPSSTDLVTASTSSSMQQNFKKGPKVKRGRPPAISKSLVSSQVRSRTNMAQHVKRLKKKALNTQVKKASANISFSRKRHLNKAHALNESSYLISNRPHRDRSGKYSIGQLWRETFLEEEHQDTVYPDSGIEVGNSSDQDQGPQSLSSVSVQEQSKIEPAVNVTDIPFKETRSHGHPLTQLNVKNISAENAVTSSTDVTATNENARNKPRLMLTITKRAMVNYPSARRGMRSSAETSFVVKKNSKNSSFSPPDLSLSKHINNKKGRGIASRQRQSRNIKPKVTTDICKCARFKQPNQLTCFGQKCPCYSEKRACVNCLCNGCKNPLRVSPDSAPPLMRFIRESADVPSHNRSMPRLSPIPKV